MMTILLIVLLVALATVLGIVFHPLFWLILIGVLLVIALDRRAGV